MRNPPSSTNYRQRILAGVLAVLALFCPPPFGRPSANAVPALRDQPRNDLALLERKLFGAWRGGACVGTLVFQSDGTYEWRHRGPGGSNSSGTWRVRWDALPPTLILTCKNSDDADESGKTNELKLTQLDDTTLEFKYPESKSSLPFSRVKE